MNIKIIVVAAVFLYCVIKLWEQIKTARSINVWVERAVLEYFGELE